ncbi:RagB/SusD family nutrient uptake outer membrane protein [uncultured Duncaniella sp.]|uniref:RagB/SusD family nutrient uptake outer membrane protein n=1 Tax=uncultured Duncaniella sp. TaxID=2768039 RepID=UPI002609C155|nr:RagB/SusD family nutrient uptake outer membrane protein [uncultured Duncaniella sp.]
MKFKSYSIAVAACLVLASCSDQFMKDMQNYESTTPEAYNYYSGALGRLADVYTLALPYGNSSSVPVWQVPSNGRADDESKCTEEYSGFGCYVNPEIELSTTSNTNGVPDYYQGQASKVRYSVWGRIRNVNDVINGVTNSTLTQEQKDELLGQAYFLRAWCYYQMFRWYGGVPIITTVLDPVPGDGTPRSTTKQTFDFICEDLDKAAELLAPFTTNGGWPTSDYGRATTAAALALKGRMMVLYASPLFNRSNDPARWTAAYNFFKEAIPEINKCGNYLAYEGNPGTNASNWAKMFVDGASEPNPEAIFVALYNNIATGGTPDYAKNNDWENGIRPSNTLGGGGKVPSAAIVDLFPMKDGKRPSSYNSYTKLNPSTITYNPDLPFVDRDPRFYRTFGFPGVCWAFNGNPHTDTNYIPYTNGSDYQLWNYVWYTDAADRNNIQSGNTFGPDGLLSNVKGMYVRKRTDDLHVSTAYRYAYTQGTGFKFSAAPYMEIRYAEVLLNYAEAACQSGKLADAVEQLQKIRSRVGYTSENNYGLDAAILGDEAACMAAILYERQIEFAYEGRRFEDLRRWLLFDGGVNFNKVPNAPATWELTGWGGNTCTYLGFAPLNGTRRENMEFRVQDKYNGGLGGDKYGSNGSNPDPLADVTRPAALDYRKDLDSQIPALSEFYTTYLERAVKKGDNYNSAQAQLFMEFRPQYYFPGLSYGAMTNNPTTQQTIGWVSGAPGGGAGKFDPLAE